MNCLNCNREVDQSTGRRARLYCNDSCKGNYWRRKKPPESKVKVLSIETYNELLEAVKKTGWTAPKTDIPKPAQKYVHVKKQIPKLTDKPDRLPGENSIEYRIRVGS